MCHFLQTENVKECMVRGDCLLPSAVCQVVDVCYAKHFIHLKARQSL